MQGLRPLRQGHRPARRTGLHFLLRELGPGALLVNFLGRCYTLDLRLDQEYIRSTPVNSEEGAPMGIGIWYEMFISDPVAYLSRTPTRAARWPPTWATPPSAA